MKTHKRDGKVKQEMSIATGELADWPKALGIPAGRTNARVPHLSVTSSF